MRIVKSTKGEVTCFNPCQKPTAVGASRAIREVIDSVLTRSSSSAAPDLLLRLEELQFLVPYRSREEVGRKRRDGGIEVAHDGVVVAPSVLDRVFYGSELRL